MNTDERVIAVVGFSRCGTSLLMRMLHQGGIPVVADNHHSYEDDRANLMNAEFNFLRECQGKAVKLLLADEMKLPELPYDFIWCRRSAREQALSQLKFLKHVGGLSGIRMELEWPRLAQGISRDTLPAQAKLRNLPGARLCEVWFERVLAYPRDEAHKLGLWLGKALDVDAMVAQVKPRTAQCYQGFMELEELPK